MVEAPENAAAFSRLRAGPRVAHWRGVETMLEIETSYAGETTTATFATFPVHVGRDEASELHLPYAFVSRSHARIERDGDGFVIVDEGSRNGITVRGEKVARGERAALVDGAIVTIEGVVVRVQFREQTQPMVRPDNMTSVYADELLVPAILAQASAVSESIAALGAVLEKVPTSRRSTIIRQLAALHPEVPFDRWWDSASDAGSAASVALSEVQKFARTFGLREVPTDPAAVSSFLGNLEHALATMLRGKVELDFVYGCETGESSHAQRAEQVAQELLDWNRSPQAALARVEQGFVDIISHHAKLVAEARAAVDSVVNRLSPAALERQTKRAWWTFPFAARTLWRTFTRRHADVAANLAAHFGPRFRGVAGALDAPRPSGPASDAASTPAEDDAEGVPAGGTHWPFEGEVRWEAQEGLNPSEVV